MGFLYSSQKVEVSSVANLGYIGRGLFVFFDKDPSRRIKMTLMSSGRVDWLG